MDYGWRALTVDDVPAWSALSVAVAAADGTRAAHSPQALAEDFQEPGFDAARDTIAVFSGPELVAAGRTTRPVRQHDGRVRATFTGRVHPDHRGRGIGGQLFDRLEQRCRALAAELFGDEPVHPSTNISLAAADAVALAESRGYRPLRYFREMVIPDLVAPDLPPDPAVEPYRPELDEAVRLAHLAAFAEHWGAAPPSVDKWRAHYTGAPTMRPACSTVAVGPDQVVIGYVLSYELRPGEIYLGQVGVRPQWRGRGWAGRLVRTALGRARAEGYRTARLHVDAANPDGAGALYESVGFRVAATAAAYGAP